MFHNIIYFGHICEKNVRFSTYSFKFTNLILAWRSSVPSRDFVRLDQFIPVNKMFGGHMLILVPQTLDFTWRRNVVHIYKKQKIVFEWKTIIVNLK